MLLVLALFGATLAASPAQADDTPPGDAMMLPSGCSGLYPWYKKRSDWNDPDNIHNTAIWDPDVYGSGDTWYKTKLTATTFYYRCKNSSGVPIVKAKKVEFCWSHIFASDGDLSGATAYLDEVDFNPFYVADGVTTNPPTYTVPAAVGQLQNCKTFDISATDEKWLKPVCDDGVPCARWKVTAWVRIANTADAEEVFWESETPGPQKYFPRDHTRDRTW